MIKRKKKRNGTKKSVSPKVQEASAVSDTETDVTDSGSEEEEEVEASEEAASEDTEASGEEPEAETEVVPEKKSPVPDWKVTCLDRPETAPGNLVFKMHNNLKVVVKEETFLRWLLSPAAKQ